jgi:hypothetical protein
VKGYIELSYRTTYFDHDRVPCEASKLKSMVGHGLMVVGAATVDPLLVALGAALIGMGNPAKKS